MNNEMSGRQTMKRFTAMTFIIQSFAVMLLVCSANGFAGQSGNNINFSATFTAGTCDISVTPASIDWGNVSSVDIRQAGEIGTASRDLTVNYSGCTGYGIKPNLLIHGDILTVGIPLFTRTEGSGENSASGYGVRLVAKDNAQTVLGDGDAVNVGIEGHPLTELNGSQTVFQASLSCGHNCSDASLHGGSLAATVTFQFLYQ